jgi:hypothetical protein
LGQFNEIGYYLSNNVLEYNACGTTPAIIIAVLDSGCIPWDNCRYNFGQLNQFSPTTVCTSPPTGNGNCRSRPEYYFIFPFIPSQYIDSMSACISSVPPGKYILAYTWFTYAYSAIPNFATAFQNLGATLISTMPDNVPYIFFMQSGNPSSIIEMAGTTSADTLELNTSVNCMNVSVKEYGDEYFSFTLIKNQRSVLLHSIEGLEEYSVHDMGGKFIASGEITGTEIQLGQLPHGAYIFTVEGENKIYKKLFVISEF